MNFLHLKYAVEVAKTGSITQAADNLYMGQPNLSKAIRELETSLGIVIFDRSSKGVQPTSAGEAFLEHARSILTQVQEIESLYKRTTEIKNSFAVSAPDIYYMANTFGDYVAQKAEEGHVFDAKYSCKKGMELILSVANEEFSCGILRYPKSKEHYYLNVLQEKGLARKRIWRFSPVLYMSNTHPLAKKEHIVKTDLEPYIEIDAESAQALLLTENGMDILDNSKTAMKVYVDQSDMQLSLLHRIKGAYTIGTPMKEAFASKNDLCVKKYDAVSGVLCDVFIYPKGYTLSAYEEEFSVLLEQVQDIAIHENNQ